MTIAFPKNRRQSVTTVAQPVHPYRIDAPSAPIAQSVRITGPATGFRLTRAGSHDFSCFANLIRTVVTPGMTDTQKALAVYRFSTRFAHHGAIGFGGTEMTRFLNCYGYSFCWGQACFQHLLYEAAGLLARSPVLTGHSSVEVFLDGQWRAIDAYMRLLIPAPDLTGIASGAQLRAQPDLFDRARRGAVVKAAKAYWAGHAPGAGTYEPWQDSRSMAITLRRGESLQMGPENRGLWCIAQHSPPDYLNGEWRWRPTLDEPFLSRECDRIENVVASAAGSSPIDPAKPAVVEFTVANPYPFVTGSANLRWSGSTPFTLDISTDQRRNWKTLASGSSAGVDAPLDAHLSLRSRPPNDEIAAHERHAFVLRITWHGSAVLNAVDVSCVIQAHAAAWPQAQRGANVFASVGADPGATLEHAWDEFPGFTVSDSSPYEGDEVTLTAVVHNHGPNAVQNVPVRFTLESGSQLIGESIVDRIEPGQSAPATVKWRAAPDFVNAVGHRPYDDTIAALYVRTHIEAHIGTTDATPQSDTACNVARATLQVRPRPIPHINEHLLFACPTRVHGQVADVVPPRNGELIVRACVIHLADVDHKFAYLRDSPLDVTVTIFDGTPDAGGVQLAAPQRLLGIQPSEFAVAEWSLPTDTLGDSLDLWALVESAAPVAPENRRLVAHRLVKIR